MSELLCLGMRAKPCARLLSLGLLVLSLAGSAQATTRTVGCPSGGQFTSIQAAVNASASGDVIVVTGTCNESVSIGDRAHLIIGASSLGSGTVVALVDNDAFDVSNSRDIRFHNLIINGGVGSSGGGGVVVFDNSQATIRNCTIQNHVDSGVAADSSSQVFIRDSTIQGNGDGVDVTRNSAAIIRNSTIVNNLFEGVFVQDRSSVQFQRQNQIANNGEVGVFALQLSRVAFGGNATFFTTIEHNAFAGILLGTQSVLRAGPSKIRYNGCTTDPLCGGIFVSRNSTVRLDGTQITNNTGPGISVEQSVDLAIFSATITNNSGDGVRIRRISIGDFITDPTIPPITIAGNGGASIFCDTTSLVVGDLTGIDNISCKQVERPKDSERSRRFKEKDKDMDP